MEYLYESIKTAVAAKTWLGDAGAVAAAWAAGECQPSYPAILTQHLGVHYLEAEATAETESEAEAREATS